MSEMIERVASAILAEAYKTGGVYLSASIAKATARAAINAMHEPTEDMRTALCKACSTDCFAGCDVGGVWDAGIDSALL